jgi:hypothetical protein
VAGHDHTTNLGSEIRDVRL